MSRPQIQANTSLFAAILVIESFALVTRACLESSLLDVYGFPPRIAKDASYLVVPPILLGLGAPILMRHRALIGKLLSKSALTFRTVLVGAALGASLRLAWWGALLTLASLNRGGAEEPAFWFACPPASQLTIYLLVMAGFVPLIEELINRGFFLHGLLRFGRALALIGSSILFGLFHQPDTILATTAIGMVLGVATLRAGTLWPAIAAHATYNSLIAVDWMCVRGLWPSTPANSPWRLAWLVSLPGFVASLVAIVWLLRRLTPADADPPARATTI